MQNPPLVAHRPGVAATSASRPGRGTIAAASPRVLVTEVAVEDEPVPWVLPLGRQTRRPRKIGCGPSFYIGNLKGVGVRFVYQLPAGRHLNPLGQWVWASVHGVVNKDARCRSQFPLRNGSGPPGTRWGSRDHRRSVADNGPVGSVQGHACRWRASPRRTSERIDDPLLGH